MNVDVFDCGGFWKPDKPYILALIEYNDDNHSIGREEWFYEENVYCFPCD